MNRKVGLSAIITGLIMASTLFTGCGPSEPHKEHENHARIIIECCEEYAEDLESVKDAETAKYAAVRMEKTNERMRQLIDDQPRLSEISKTEAKEIAKIYGERFTNARKRIGEASDTAVPNGKSEPTFLRAFDNMKALIAKARF